MYSAGGYQAAVGMYAFCACGFVLLPELFTMTELQKLYEVILEVKFDRRNFAKKIQSLELVTAVENEIRRTSSRIPIRFKFNKNKYEELKKGFRMEF